MKYREINRKRISFRYQQEKILSACVLHCLMFREFFTVAWQRRRWHFLPAVCHVFQHSNKLLPKWQWEEKKQLQPSRNLYFYQIQIFSTAKLITQIYKISLWTNETFTWLFFCTVRSCRRRRQKGRQTRSFFPACCCFSIIFISPLIDNYMQTNEIVLLTVTYGFINEIKKSFYSCKFFTYKELCAFFWFSFCWFCKL